MQQLVKMELILTLYAVTEQEGDSSAFSSLSFL